MQKTKLILTACLAIGTLLFSANGVLATSASIQQLPSYITTDSFKLSCSVLGGSTAQFSVSKNGGSFNNFGSAIDLSTSQCQVQVTGSQIDEQTSYTFRVTIDGSLTRETSTFYDISGPSPVQNYYKEGLGGNNFKLHWKNPGDTDFAKVVIYRGDSQGFSADASHEIARVNGSPDSDMTYDETVPDSAKTYYYAFRALDKAGNSSSLVGDGVTTVTTLSSPSPNPNTNNSGGNLIVLPSQSSQTGNGKNGSVLGQETATESQTVSTTEPQGPNANIVQGLSTKKKLAIAAVILAAGVATFYLVKNKKLLDRDKKSKK